MWELYMDPDYYDLHILLTSIESKLQSQTNIFPGSNNPFSIKSFL